MVSPRLIVGLIVPLLLVAADVRAQSAVGSALGAPAQPKVAVPAAPPTVTPPDDDNEPLDPAVREQAAGFGVSAEVPSVTAQTILRAKGTTRAAAVAAEDWRAAAFLGATAADIVRAQQGKGLYTDVNPDIAVVVITSEGVISAVYGLKPLPPLPGTATTAPVNLGGVAPPDPYVEGVTPGVALSSQGFDGVGFNGITLRPPYFGSDYGSGALTPQAAAQNLGLSL